MDSYAVSIILKWKMFEFLCVQVLLIRYLILLELNQLNYILWLSNFLELRQLNYIIWNFITKLDFHQFSPKSAIPMTIFLVEDRFYKIFKIKLWDWVKFVLNFLVIIRITLDFAK